MSVGGATPFLLAARAMDVEVMRLLADHGADPQLTTVEGTTPLAVAAGVGYNEGTRQAPDEQVLEAIALAIALGNDANLANKHGQTPLHGAVYRGLEPAIQLLVDEGAKDYHLDGLPFGTRGGKAVRHYFPLDGEYEFRGFLKRTQQTGIRGLAEPHTIEVVVDGRRVALFSVGGPDAYEQIGTISTVVGVTKAFSADEVLRVRAPITAGYHSVAVTFIQRPRALVQDLRRPYLSSYRADPQAGCPTSIGSP